MGEVEGAHAVARATFTTEWKGDDQRDVDLLAADLLRRRRSGQARDAGRPVHRVRTGRGEHRRPARDVRAGRGRRSPRRRREDRRQVVEGSGTGELSGIRGEGSYAADAMEYTVRTRLRTWTEPWERLARAGARLPRRGAGPAPQRRASSTGSPCSTSACRTRRRNSRGWRSTRGCPRRRRRTRFGPGQPLALVWSLRGAPYVHRRDDLDAVAAALYPMSEQDAGGRLNETGPAVKRAGIPAARAVRDGGRRCGRSSPSRRARAR